MDWREIEASILSSLDLRSECEALGVRFVAAAPSSTGWLECHAIDREDNTPSAAVCVAGEASIIGRYKDLGDGNKSLSLWELRAKLVGGDWRDARQYYADRAGVPLNGLAKKPEPTSKVDLGQITFITASAGVVREWCEQHKPGVTMDALRAAGARQCLWPTKSPSPYQCVAIPGYRNKGEPTAWVLYRLDGEQFPEHQSIKARKIHSVKGSVDSWIIPGGWAAIERAAVVWKVEGPSDALALYPHLQPGHAVITNSGGAAASPEQLPLSMFRGKQVRVIGDADKAGQSGAERFAQAFAAAGATAQLVRLPYAVTDSHGRDLRDWLNEGHTAADLDSLDFLPVDAAPPKPIQQSRATDMANAERLMAAHGADLRFVWIWQKWLVWTGKYWSPDSAEVWQHAKAVARSIYTEAEKEEDQEQKRELLKWAKSSESTAKQEAFVKSASRFREAQVSVQQLDTDPYKLNCDNGTVDLRTGEMSPHSREDYLTKACPVAYDPAATCPTWERFLGRIFADNTGLIEFIQRAAGYSLTGAVVERCLFILHGQGRNGKSTFLETLAGILGVGGYAMRTPTDTLVARNPNAIPNDLARLKGVRFAWASETNEGERLSESSIKDMTGAETITARFMRAEWFDFRPEFKLWLGTNHKPAIRGTDEAIWDRIRLIPFSVRIPDEEIDRDLPTKLAEESSGILAWAVRGCLAWQRDGLTTPPEVRDATESYRRDLDTLGEYLADHCVVAKNASVLWSVLWVDYCQWCEDSGQKPWSQKRLSLKLQERGFARSKSKEGRTRDKVLVSGLFIKSMPNINFGSAKNDEIL